jgi:hypothetical protein
MTSADDYSENALVEQPAIDHLPGQADAEPHADADNSRRGPEHLPGGVID